MPNLSDSFDRADSSTLGIADSGQTWSPDVGSWGISSNTAQLQGNGGDSQDIATLEAGITDGTLQVTLSTFGLDAGCVFRVVDSSNYYVFRSDGGAYVLFRRLGGSFSVLGTGSAAGHSGDIISIVLSGSSITCSVNGVLQVSVTDSNITGTRYGIRSFQDTSTRFNDFSFTGSGATASPFNGAVFENPNPKRVVKDKSFNSPFPINLYGKDTFFGAPGQAPEYTLDKPTKLRSNSRLNYEINTNLGLYFPVTPFIVYEDTRPNRRKTNTLNFESNLDLDLITVSVVPFVAYDVDRKFLRRNRNLDWINNTDINLFSISSPFLVTEVTIPRRLLRQFRDFNAPINLNLLGKDTFFGAPGQAPLFDLKNPNTHRSNARLSFEVPITLFNRIPPTPVDDTTALLLFANLHIRLDVKREMDSGNVDALASDVGGTPVTFNKAFLDVDSITLTVAATQPITAIYDFVDVPNPTGFTVYAYDSSGNRVNFTVSWKARGIV